MTKKLKDIIDTKKIKELECKDAYVPENPIHFKYVKNSEGNKENIQEKIDPVEFYQIWKNHNQNKHLGDFSYQNVDISARLHNIQNKHKMSEDDIRHVRNYSDMPPKRGNSKDVNNSLIAQHKGIFTTHEKHEEAIHHLDKVTQHPTGTHLHVYSGIGFNPTNHMKINNLIHLPAYTSTSHDKEIAMGFAEPHNDSEGVHHILHIHLKPHDKSRNIEHITRNSGEHETILPRGTTLKLHPKPTLANSNGGRNYKIWHATVHHQEDYSIPEKQEEDK